MPKILHVFPTFAVGGSQARLARLLNYLPANADSHNILALDGNYAAATLIKSESPFQPIENPIPDGLSMPKRLTAINKVLSAMLPDVLMTYNWGSIEWAFVNALSTRMKHIHWEDGFGPDEQYHLKTRRNIARQYVLARSNRVVVPSKNLSAIALHQWKLSPKIIEYLPNGVSIPKEVAPLQNTLPILATVATLRPEKNIERLIRAVASLHITVELRIAGDGPDKPKLQSLVNDLGLSNVIKFAGHTNDVYGFLQEASIFCLSSNTEQMPISVLEAMAIGLPVVSTNVGDVAQMVSDENRSFVVPPDLFEKALSEMISQPNIWATLGVANRQKAIKDFSFGQMLNRFEALCQS